MNRQPTAFTINVEINIGIVGKIRVIFRKMKKRAIDPIPPPRNTISHSMSKTSLSFN